MTAVDYLIVGAGAIGLGVADTLIAESDVTVAIIDRGDQPGGHWNNAYDFVRLHQPSLLYGVNSLALGSGEKDTTGWNAGLHELATGEEVLAYLQRVMSDVLLPSGRIQYFNNSDYRGDGRFVSTKDGTEQTLEVRRKVVDATYYGTTIPLTHTPSFSVHENVAFVTPNALSAMKAKGWEAWERLCILGGGKTSMDVGVWAQENGVAADQISWVRPRESWLLNRQSTQPGIEFFHDTIGMMAAQLKAFAKATSINDLFLKLEANGQMLRIDPDVIPSMYHCAIMSEGEARLLNQVKDVLRQGHVTSIDQNGLNFDAVSVSMPERTLYVDCTAGAITRRPTRPVYEDGLMTPQLVRSCQPTFSAAMIAHIELMDISDAEKNMLCRPLPLPDTSADFIPFTMLGMMNEQSWSRDPGLREWMLNCRLDGFAKIIAEVRPDEADKLEVLSSFKANAGQALGNIQALMAHSS